jgi:hypothetical protein
MYNGPIIKGRQSMGKLLRRLDPNLRNEFIAEGIREERASHIQEENGKFIVNIDDEKKEYETFEEADQKVDQIFKKNPLESNYSNLEK